MLRTILSLSLILLHFILQAQIPAIDQFVNKKIQKKKIAGAVVLVTQNNKTIHHKAYGYQDRKDKIKMDTNSIFRIYSMTKPITSVAILILAEQGKLNIDDPVIKYIPEFKNLMVYTPVKNIPLKQDITIRDLLRHTAGFSYGFFSNTAVDKLYKKKHPLFVNSSEAFIKRVSQLPLLYQPATKHHYSIATDILGVIIERVSKTKLSVFMKKHLFDPLEMNNTSFQVPQSKVEQFCSSYTQKLKEKDYYKTSDYLSQKNFESGGGGLVSTSTDYQKFSAMLLNKGKHKQLQILSPQSVTEMTRNQLNKGDGAYKGISGIGFGLGVSVQLKEWGKYGHKGDYGWSGAASTHFFNSPSKNVSVIILTQIQPYSNQMQSGLKPIILQHLE